MARRGAKTVPCQCGTLRRRRPSARPYPEICAAFPPTRPIRVRFTIVTRNGSIATAVRFPVGAQYRNADPSGGSTRQQRPFGIRPVPDKPATQHGPAESGEAQAHPVAFRTLQTSKRKAADFRGKTEFRRSGRVVECAGLENRPTGFTTDVATDSYDCVKNRLSPDLSLIAPNDSQLTELIRAWSGLPEALRGGIVAIVNATKSKQV